MEPYIPLLSAAVAAVAAIIVAVIQSRAQHNQVLAEIVSQHNQVLAEMDKRDALQAQRIEHLEKKMDKHNNMIERTYALEQRAAVQEEQIKVANHRIDDLEKKG